MRLLSTVMLIMALPQLFDLRSGNYGCTASSHFSWFKNTVNPRLSSHNNVINYDQPLAETHTNTAAYHLPITQQPFGFMNSTPWTAFNTLPTKSEKLYKRIKREKKKARRRELRHKKQKRIKKARRIERKRKRKLSNFIKEEEVRGNTITRKNGDIFIDCCPSREVVRRSTVGKDRGNHAVAIKPIANLFYEVECLHGVEGNECTFPPRMARSGYSTECVQRYSFTQAHVRSFDGDGEWRIDYIKVKSGCSCEIRVDPKRKNTT